MYRHNNHQDHQAALCGCSSPLSGGWGIFWRLHYRSITLSKFEVSNSAIYAGLLPDSITDNVFLFPLMNMLLCENAKRDSNIIINASNNNYCQCFERKVGYGTKMFTDKACSHIWYEIVGYWCFQC